MDKKVLKHPTKPQIFGAPDLVGQPDYLVTQVGKTTHVKVFSAQSLGEKGVQLGQKMLPYVEKDFLHVGKLFGVELPAVNLFLSPLSEKNDGTGGGYHYGCGGTDLYIDVDFVPSINIWTSLGLFVSELTELAEAVQGRGWDCEGSNGKGLSRVIANAIHPKVLDSYATAAFWLDSFRPNYVNFNSDDATDNIAIGCSVLFLNWLHNQFTFTQICSAGANNLGNTFQGLTGRTTAWFEFTAAVNNKWPQGQPSGVKTDDPW